MCLLLLFGRFRCEPSLVVSTLILVVSFASAHSLSGAGMSSLECVQWRRQLYLHQHGGVLN
jgi:hypothetical protein